VSKNDELTRNLESTLGLGLLNLPPSELKKAAQVTTGGNRPDLLIGGDNPPKPAQAKAAPAPAVRVAPVKAASAPKAKGSKAKYAQLTRIDVRLRDDQVDFLTNLELKLRRRDSREERITKASIVRAIIDVLPHLDLDLNGAVDEESLRVQIFQRLGMPQDKASQRDPKTAKSE